MEDLQLELPTGALIAGDAAALFADARPLVGGLPLGSFPARLQPGGLEVLLAKLEPVEWDDHQPDLETPSGCAVLLDAAALAEYTDLGDEPVDEFELLSERLAGQDAALFNGVLAVRLGTPRAHLSLGRDEYGLVCRILLRASGEIRPA